MILYDVSSYRDVIFRIEGSVLVKVLPQLLVTVVLSLVAAAINDKHPIDVPVVVFALVVIALGFLLVFRSNLSYERHWEGRGLLATLTSVLRDLARMCTVYVEDTSPEVAQQKQEFVRLLKVVFALVRMHLRNECTLEEDKVANSLLTSQEKLELERRQRRPLIAIAWLSNVVNNLHRQGHMSDVRLQCLDRQFAILNTTFNGLDKIVTTPLPFPYAQMLLLMLTGYCAALPFSLVSIFKWLTFLPAGLVTLSLFGINSVALEIEDPFGHDANDLPIDHYDEQLAQDVDTTLAIAKLGM